MQQQLNASSKYISRSDQCLLHLFSVFPKLSLTTFSSFIPVLKVDTPFDLCTKPKIFLLSPFPLRDDAEKNKKERAFCATSFSVFLT